ncbi:glycine-rich domain-containing protein [Kitasatospora sp. P5_F3]
MNELPEKVRDLIGSGLGAQLVEDVRKGWPDLTDDLGERGVNQMVAFLVTSTRTSEVLTPPLRVDEFWHRFILRTQPYAEFCAALRVGFIHHVPDEAGTVDPAKGRAAMAQTVAAIESAGFQTDPEFWPGMGAADCNQCHAGCTDGPVGG